MNKPASTLLEFLNNNKDDSLDLALYVNPEDYDDYLIANPDTEDVNIRYMKICPLSNIAFNKITKESRDDAIRIILFHENQDKGKFYYQGKKYDPLWLLITYQSGLLPTEFKEWLETKANLNLEILAQIHAEVFLAYRLPTFIEENLWRHNKRKEVKIDII